MMAFFLEPHHQEERHHGGDEVRVRDLPGAPMVPAAVSALLLADDDLDLLRGGVGHQPAVCLRARQASSTSSDGGRSSEKIALRANSTATLGAAPRSEAMMPSLMQRRYLPLATSCISTLVAIGPMSP